MAPSRHLREGADGGFESTAGAAVVLALGKRLGIPGRTAAAVLRAAHAGGADGHELLRELAARVATGLAAVACLLEPELIVVAGAVGLAGGPDFVELVAGELAAITIVTPRMELSAIGDNPVLAGARLTALKAARERLFHGTAALEPGDQP
jgi:predicted NBD/HSP70 family sugar kinase